MRRIRNIKNLFFVRRRPRWHVDSHWERPRDDDSYHQLLEYNGFVSYKYWQKDDLLKYPTLKQDLDDLEEHMLPAFWEFNQKAQHFQNRFYLYQWVFMLGAFFTTFFGALTTYAYTVTPDGGMATNVFGICTAVISAATAYFNVMSDQGSPQQRWAKTRRLAEELRMTYYRYLAHLEPFNDESRVKNLRRYVIDVRRKENENG